MSFNKWYILSVYCSSKSYCGDLKPQQGSFPLRTARIPFKKTKIHFREQLISFEKAKYFVFVLDALRYCGQMLSSYNKPQFLLHE